MFSSRIIPSSYNTLVISVGRTVSKREIFKATSKCSEYCTKFPFHFSLFNSMTYSMFHRSTLWESVVFEGMCFPSLSSIISTLEQIFICLQLQKMMKPSQILTAPLIRQHLSGTTYAMGFYIAFSMFGPFRSLRAKPLR